MSYLQPICDFDIKLRDALHAVVEGVDSLRWLEVCLVPAAISDTLPIHAGDTHHASDSGREASFTPPPSPSSRGRRQSTPRRETSLPASPDTPSPRSQQPLRRPASATSSSGGQLGGAVLAPSRVPRSWGSFFGERLKKGGGLDEAGGGGNAHIRANRDAGFGRRLSFHAGQSGRVGKRYWLGGGRDDVEECCGVQGVDGCVAGWGGGEEVESRRSGRRRLEIYSLPSKVADSGVEMPAGAAWAFWGVLGGYEYRVALGEALCGW